MDDFAELAAAQMLMNGPRELSSFPELGPFIYYIQCGAFIKIGTSINPESRCNQLERGGKAKRPSIWVGNPHLIAYIPGNVAKERELHREFASIRDEGEWFLMNDDLIEHVADIQVQQCLAEIHIHEAHYIQMVEANNLTPVTLDLAKIYQQHLATKGQLDPEWIAAFAA
jgi:hypothetical protein